MNMRILLVSSYPFTNEPGGVKDFILGLKSSLQKKGCIVTVIAPGSKEAEEKGLVDFSLGRDFKIGTDQTEFRGSFSRKKTARQILREIQPDIIVIHEPLVPTMGHTIISAIERKKYIPIPVVVGQFHARREDLGFRFRAIEFIGKHIIRRPKLNNKRTGFVLSSGYISTINNNLDARISVSEASKKFWQKKYPAQYKVIYNGIDTNELNPDGEKINSWQEDGRKIILFAGRHDSRKGIDDLINAFDLLIKSGVNVKLKIAGEGEMTGVLKEMAQRLNLSELIEFVGVMARGELVKAYRTADLVVAPSTDGEGFNRTIAEARSCGTLVVCTDIEGQKEAIGEDLSEFMAKPKNPKDLARQIKAILSLANIKKEEIRKKGIKDVKNRFDWANIANEHLLFYKSLVAK